ncbi:hypothetical protein [Mycobacteroides chelonae]|uniref:hypothetical protein n=1 Tax=Mycobacteroides chelonae TaxID=1774 RepID=UPI0008A83ED4|nr:hypothetical protein [Mycobacteroides chelonae]OHU12923.1 hypothetical protein BKG75_18095 [Mycobacteroides chelonae]
MITDPTEVRLMLLELLEQQEHELTTRQIAALMPPKSTVVNVACNSRCRRINRWSTTETVLEHHRHWHRIQSPRTAADVYRHLRVLEDVALVIAWRSAGQRDVTWEYSGGLGEFDEEYEPYLVRPLVTVHPDPRYL